MMRLVLALTVVFALCAHLPKAHAHNTDEPSLSVTLNPKVFVDRSPEATQARVEKFFSRLGVKAQVFDGGTFQGFLLDSIEKRPCDLGGSLMWRGSDQKIVDILNSNRQILATKTYNSDDGVCTIDVMLKNPAYALNNDFFSKVAPGFKSRLALEPQTGVVTAFIQYRANGKQLSPHELVVLKHLLMRSYPKALADEPDLLAPFVKQTFKFGG